MHAEAIASPGTDDNLAAEVRSIIVVSVAAVKAKVASIIEGEMTEEQTTFVAKLGTEMGTLLNSIGRANDRDQRGKLTLARIEKGIASDLNADERAHLLERLGVGEGRTSVLS